MYKSYFFVCWQIIEILNANINVLPETVHEKIDGFVCLLMQEFDGSNFFQKTGRFCLLACLLAMPRQTDRRDSSRIKLSSQNASLGRGGVGGKKEIGSRPRIDLSLSFFFSFPFLFASLHLLWLASHDLCVSRRKELSVKTLDYIR